MASLLLVCSSSSVVYACITSIVVGVAVMAVYWWQCSQQWWGGMGVLAVVAPKIDGLLNMLDRSKLSLLSIRTWTCLIFPVLHDAHHHVSTALVSGQPFCFPPPASCSSLTLTCFPFGLPFLEICILTITFCLPALSVLSATFVLWEKTLNVARRKLRGSWQ